MRCGHRFVVSGIHPRTKSGIVGLYERFAEDMSIRRKSALGLVYLRERLVATFTYGEEADDQNLIALAEQVIKKYNHSHENCQKLVYAEAFNPDRPDLLVCAYRAVTCNNWLVAPQFIMGSMDEQSAHSEHREYSTFLGDNLFLESGQEKCFWCGAKKGQHHGGVCRDEICPKCGRQLLNCECTKSPKEKPPGDDWDWCVDGWWPKDKIRIVFG